MYWDKYSHKQIKERVFGALDKNLNYRKEPILGLPATYLDPLEFYSDAPFLKDAPFITSLIENPNHIGCHTLVQSEEAFAGTHQIERELIAICAEEIFKGDKGEQDGYVAPGGTEANIQAMWIYRNYFIKEFGAKHEEIAVVYSEDSHYSMPKGANILNLSSIIMKVDEDNRSIQKEVLKTQLKESKEAGKKYFIVIMNLSTTMFGSVDDIDGISQLLEEEELNYKIHVDGAFGGFIYPFTNPDSVFHFQNPKITSFTLDAHKMLQAPYGTGIFLIRKGYMDYALTEEANYVQGKDYTICGSRSGANAISVWMILRAHGSDGWKVKMQQLAERTERLCDQLTDLGISYYRDPYINIIAIKAADISADIAHKYYLVPDTHEGTPKWWKIVVMDHVRQGLLDEFSMALQAQQ
jgi:glutamate/tyrosine decarboxylase-like PLP-dependent enzyme